MRVLHVVTHHSPDHVFGGPTRVAVNLCRELRAAGDDAALLTVGEGFTEGLPDAIDGVPAKVFPVRTLVPGFGFSGKTSPALLARAGAYVRSADLVHVHLARDLVTFPLALQALVSNRPLVVQTHGMIDPTTVRAARIADRLGVRQVLRRADVLLHLTGADRIGVAAVAAPHAAARSVRLVNGVAPQPRRAARSDRGGPPVVLFLARLEELKRPADFVAAIPAVRREYPDARFQIAGADTGGMAERLRAQAAELGAADAVEYLGPLEHDAVLERMRQADVYVLPSTFETFSVTALEALSVGLPVVVTRTNGLAPAVEESGAGLVVDSREEQDPAGNGEGIGRAVAELLAPAANERASEAAWRLARERFSIDAVAARLRWVYTEVLKARGDRR